MAARCTTMGRMTAWLRRLFGASPPPRIDDDACIVCSVGLWARDFPSIRSPSARSHRALSCRQAITPAPPCCSRLRPFCRISVLQPSAIWLRVASRLDELSRVSREFACAVRLRRSPGVMRGGRHPVRDPGCGRDPVVVRRARRPRPPSRAITWSRHEIAHTRWLDGSMGRRPPPPRDCATRARGSRLPDAYYPSRRKSMRS